MLVEKNVMRRGMKKHKPITPDQNQEASEMKSSTISEVLSTFCVKPLTLISKRRKTIKTKILERRDTKTLASLGAQRRRRPLLLTDLKL